MLDWLMVLILFLAPCTLMGEEFMSGAALVAAGVVLIMRRREKIKVDSIWTSLMAILIVCGVASMVQTKNPVQSLSGLTVLVNMVMFYFVFCIMKKDRKKFYEKATLGVAALSTICVLYQGVFQQTRITGNIGYANSYALLLMITLYMNELREERRFHLPVQMLLMVGILYTGSRSTLALLMVFMAFMSMRELKEKRELEELLAFVSATITYASASIMGIGALLLVLPAVYGMVAALRKMKVKHRNLLLGMLMIAAMLSPLCIQANTAQRVKNAKLHNGSFQERLVMFQDGMKHISKHPMGSGLNSFECTENQDASAFYDVKYIHNSILQAGYDAGIPGMLAFIAMIIQGTRVLLKCKEKDRGLVLLLWITVFVHSLLDFDFSFATIAVVPSMLVAFHGEARKEWTITKRSAITAASGAFMALGLYVAVVEGSLSLSSMFMRAGNPASARNVLSVNKAIAPGDARVHVRISDTCKEEYDESHDAKALSSCESQLEEARKLNSEDPRVLWNLAYVKDKLGKAQEALNCWDQLMQQERYYFGMYKDCNEFLMKMMKEHPDDGKYPAQLERLKKLHAESFKQLNPRAGYMKDQLKESFEETVKIVREQSNLGSGVKD